MPIVPTSPSKCTYSWLLAYLLSSGVMRVTPLFLSLVERRGDDAGPSLFAADQHRELRAGRRLFRRKIREADRFFQRRRVGAAGDDADLAAAVDDRLAVPGDAAVDHLESDELPPRPLGVLALQDVAAVEVAFFDLDDPAEVGLERRRGLVDVVAVEGHFRLEAQRVARAEAARLDVAGLDELAEDPLRLRRREVELEAVLAGVAGAGDDGIDAVDVAAREAVVLDRTEVDVDERLEVALRVRALERELRVVRALVPDFRIHALRAVGEPLEVLVLIRGVDDDEVVVRADAIDEDVVDEAGGGVEKAVVLRAAVLELRDVVAGGALEQRERVGALDRELAHVRDVEKAGAGAPCAAARSSASHARRWGSRRRGRHRGRHSDE